jgi:two-component system chemotaxis response regulator CheB
MLYQDSTSSTPKLKSRAPEWLVVIGGGSGGLQALAIILPEIPSGFPGTIIVAQHARRGFSRVIAQRFSHVCNIPVSEPTDGQALQASRILIAPGDAVLKLEDLGGPAERDYEIILQDWDPAGPIESGRINTAMIAAAKTYGKHAIGVLLSGFGVDGIEGMQAIKGAGGLTIAQDQASSVISDLPLAAATAGHVHELIPVWNIGPRIVKAITEKANAIAA